MKKYRKQFVFSFLCLLVLSVSGCNKEPESTPVQSEMRQDDFVFHLMSEKNVYKQGEPIRLRGQLIYVGDGSGKQIEHGESVMGFGVAEKTKGVIQHGAIRGSFNQMVLAKEVPYEEVYDLHEGLPKGHYTVTSYADFSDKHSDSELNATIEFIATKKRPEGRFLVI